MQFKHFYAIFAIVLGCGLASCHSDIDLENIDTKAEVDMGLALPVGSVHATIADLFGSGVGKFYVDSLDNKGVITWKDTFKIARNFHQVDLAQYISEKQLKLNVYDLLPDAIMVGTNKQVIGIGVPMTLDFDLPLKLSGINDAASIDKERLDSALIDMASFSSVLNTDNLPLEWEWIDQVTLDLGDQMRRPAGNTMVIYDKTRDNYGYGQTIPTQVDHFTINMMKNNTIGQVIDSCNFTIHFTFTIPSGTTISVPEGAGLDYKLGVQFIDYTAIWGKFSRSEDMYDENVVDLSSSWGALDFLSRSNIPFADPRIDMHIITRVAGAMLVDGDYLYSVDANNNKHYATFLYGGTTKQDFHKQFYASEYIDPITSAIGDSTTNMILKFDKDPERGHIDNMFQNMPQQLGYKFGIDFNYTLTPQIRITPNTSVRIDAICTLPMIFGPGLRLEYNDTIRDVNLSQYRIESLIGDTDKVKVKESDITAVIKAKNEIPLDIRAYLRCLDEHGGIIMDPEDKEKPLLLFPEDTITIKAPNYVKTSGIWQAEKPGETTILANLSKAKMDLFPQIKNIVYYVFIDDASLQDAYSKGLENIRITDDQGLTIQIGLAAKVDAIVEFGKQDNNNNNK